LPYHGVLLLDSNKDEGIMDAYAENPFLKETTMMINKEIHLARS